MKCYEVKLGYGKATQWGRFGLRWQPTLHEAQERAAEAAVTACRDDTYLQGCEDAVIAGATHIMSRHACQRSKTLVFCTDQSEAEHVAAKLSATVAMRGMVACGTALGYDVCIADHVQRRCDITCEQIEKLVGLPLDPQTKWNVLHNCLEHREAHLLRNTMWMYLAVPLRQVETVMLRAVCEIIGVYELTEMQKVQVHLPHRHGGMGHRHFNKDVGTAPRLSSAALAHAALTDGNERALPFRGMAEVDARMSLNKLREAWPSINGLSDSPDEPVELARLPPDGKMLRMAALQQAVSRADARVAALFATLEANARGPAARPKDQALADLSCLRNCSGALASAWLTARPGFTELTAIDSFVNARLRLGEILLAGQDGDGACVRGRLMPAGGTQSPICGALWRTVVARHNGMAQAWCRAFSRCGVACALEPHVQQLPKFQRAAGLRALPARDETTTIRAHGLPKRDRSSLTRRSPVYPRLGRTFNPHGTQALTNPSQPDLAPTACPPQTA